MKTFESFLAPQLDAYLAYRSGLGYRPSSYKKYLLSFDRYLIETKAGWSELLEPLFFLELRGSLELEPQSINQTMSALRGLFAFFLLQDIVKENPLLDIPAVTERLFIPFVFSPEQIDLLLTDICKRIRKTNNYFLLDLATYLVITLLARCGMRISEPVKILRNNYRSEEGTLYIERTKFYKDRLIPVPNAAWNEIDNYLPVRNFTVGRDQNPYLFVGKEDKRLTIYRITAVFKRAVKAIGINEPRRQMGNMTFGPPTPHSLRHSFAINTLKRIREQGKDPQHALPVLAAYMGHREYQYTAAYLKVLDANQRQGMIEFAKAFRARP